MQTTPETKPQSQERRRRVGLYQPVPVTTLWRAPVELALHRATPEEFARAAENYRDPWHEQGEPTPEPCSEKSGWLTDDFFVLRDGNGRFLAILNCWSDPVSSVAPEEFLGGLIREALGSFAKPAENPAAPEVADDIKF